MTKKIFLTSAVVFGISCPAFAVPLNTSATFPNDEYMLEDYTYQNQATYTNMGVYSGSVDILAEYDDIPYTVSAGYYLPAAGEAVVTCTAGNYCPGLPTQVTYDADNAQGIESCSDLGDNSYTQSEKGASLTTDCYKACTTSNISNSAKVFGNDYYGAGVDICGALSCANGYHRQTGTVETAVGDTAGSAVAYVDGSSSFTETGASNGQAYYGLSSDNSFAVDYGTHGMIQGAAACSTISGTATANGENSIYSTATAITDETGTTGATYCWCQMNGYTPDGGSLQSVSSRWISGGNMNSVADCTSDCAEACASNLSGTTTANLFFRYEVLGTLPGGAATCAANTITINWTGASEQAILDNNAGTCEYNGDIRTPKSAITLPGKTFKGWKFIKP